MRKIDWRVDGSDLMEDAEVYYQEAINTHRWGKKTQKQDVVYAFKAESDEEVNEPETTNSFEETIKALSAQLREYTEANTARSKNVKFDDVKAIQEEDDKYAWKLIPPKDKEPTVKRMLVDGITKTYYWCPNHHQWTIHKPSECKRQTSKNKKKQAKMKIKKRENFKAKKKAYMQAKAAYQACKYESSEEDVELSNSDYDEDSNKSVSTYSSEGSNTS
jgi:hypothetical protein